MRTTVEIADELFRRAKAEAALRGRRFKDLVEEGLQRVLEESGATPPETGTRPQTLAELMEDCRGIIDSEVEDLASNSEHMESFGRDSMGHR